MSVRREPVSSALGEDGVVEVLLPTKNTSNVHDTWKFWKKKRYLLSVIIFFGLMNVYILRVNLSVAVVAMTSPYNLTLDNGTVVETQDFYWDSKTRGFVLSSFFYGYICTNLLGGWLAARWGGVRLFGVGVGVTALLTTLTPPAARISLYLMLVFRVIEGFFEGVTFPCFHAILAKWAPPIESSFMYTIGYTGVPVGTVLGLQASGVVGSVFGWPAIFYIPGMFGLVWWAVWFAVVNERPEDDPHVSPEELKHIKESLGGSDTPSGKVTHPWGKFITSMPFWAIVVVNFCAIWGHYTLLTQLPTFLKDVLDFHLVKSGIMSSLPYVAMGLSAQICANISDWLRKKNILTTGQVRKMFVSVPLLLQAVSLSLVGHLTSSISIIACFIIALTMEGCVVPSFSVNMLDIAPEHASVILGFANTIATIPGIVSPIVTGYIVTDQDVEQWRIVFYITSVLATIAAFFYAVFASGEKQSWSTTQVSAKDDKDMQ